MEKRRGLVLTLDLTSDGWFVLTDRRNTFALISSWHKSDPMIGGRRDRVPNKLRGHENRKFQRENSSYWDIKILPVRGYLHDDS